MKADAAQHLLWPRPVLWSVLSIHEYAAGCQARLADILSPR